MPDFISLGINAVVLSSLFATVALGFTLIFSVGNILNLSHGALLTTGAFVAYVVINTWNQGVWIALLTATILTSLLGVVVYIGVLRYVHEDPVQVMVLTLILGIVIQHVLRVSITNTTVTIRPLVTGTTTIHTYSIPTNMILLVVLSWLLIFVLFAFIDHTQVGKAIRAVSMSQKGATLVGIDIHRINLYTWALAAMYAGFAGVLLLSFQGGDWQMGNDPLIISFAIVVVGGLGSVRGSVVGAYIIGTAETLVTSLLSAQLTGFASFVIVIAILLLKPSGLYGRNEPTNAIREVLS